MAVVRIEDYGLNLLELIIDKVGMKVNYDN